MEEGKVMIWYRSGVILETDLRVGVLPANLRFYAFFQNIFQYAHKQSKSFIQVL